MGDRGACPLQGWVGLVGLMLVLGGLAGAEGPVLSKDGKLQSGPRPRPAAGPLRGFAVTRPSDQEARRKNKMKKHAVVSSTLCC